jgi:hypothetical protein
MSDKFIVNDFAESPGILGRIIPDSGLAAVFNIASIVAASVYISPLAAIAMIAFAAKDVVYFHRKEKADMDQLTQKLLGGSDDDQALPPTTVDVSVQPAIVATVVVAEPESLSVDLLNLPKLIVDEIYSYAVIAPSGGGKGMLMSNVIREFKQRYPDRPVILIDPKDDPKEAGYWTGIVDIWHKGNFRKMEIEEKSAFLHEALDLIRSIEGEHLAIMDECTMTFGFANKCDTKLANRLQDFTTSVASGGNSAEEYVFLMGHSPNLSDYGISGGQMSSFRKIYIAPTSNQESIIQLCGTTFAGGKQGDQKAKEIVAIAEQSPVQRAVYVGTKNAWYPMAKLENYSGYDRDTRTQIDIVTPVVDTPIVTPAVEPSTPLPAYDPHFEVFVATLTATLQRAKQDQKDLNAVTPEMLTQHRDGQKIGLTLENAKIALSKAKQAIGVQ